MSFFKWIFIILIINLSGALASLLWYLGLELPAPYMATCHYSSAFSEFIVFVYIANMMSGAVGAFWGYVGRPFWEKTFKIKLTSFSAAVSGAIIFFVMYFIISSFIILYVD